MQRAVALLGVLLMLTCAVWLQLLPPGDRSTAIETAPIPGEGAIKRVVIDAGHGGQDSGAIHGGIEEKTLTLDVAKRLERLVRAKGFATVLTRSGDHAVSLADRATKANAEHDCIFVSIHFDEGGRAAATGVQTFYAVRQNGARTGIASWLPFLQRVSSEPSNLESQSLAGFVQNALVARTQAFNRGTRAEQFYVVANVRHPAVLVEGGFLSNNDDIGKLTTDAYREQLALAISEGILQYREAISRNAASVASAGPGT